MGAPQPVTSRKGLGDVYAVFDPELDILPNEAELARHQSTSVFTGRSIICTTCWICASTRSSPTTRVQGS